MSEYPMPTLLEQWIYHLYFISIFVALLTPALLFHTDLKWSSRFSYKTAMAISIALQVPVFVFLVANIWLPYVKAEFAAIYSWFLQLIAFFGLWAKVIRKLPRQRITDV